MLHLYDTEALATLLHYHLNDGLEIITQTPTKLIYVILRMLFYNVTKLVKTTLLQDYAIDTTMMMCMPD